MWPSEETGPYGIAVFNIARGLEESGFEVDTRAAALGGARDLGTKLRRHAGLAAQIVCNQARHADAIYLHAPSWFAGLCAVSNLRRRPLAIHLHGGEVFPYSAVERRSGPIVSRALARADLVVAPSRDYALRSIARFGLDSSRVFVSPSGGIDTTLFRPIDKASARRALGLPEHALVLGFFGRIVADKGWRVALEVLGALARERIEVFLLVIGDGPDQEALRIRAGTLGLGHRLVLRRFVGQPALAEAYGSLDLLLFPTVRAEALGLVALEALASGVPVVGSDRFAVPEYVCDGETGYLADPDRPDSFVAAIHRHRELGATGRGSMSDRARSMALAYDRIGVRDALASRIRELIETKRRSDRS